MSIHCIREIVIYTRLVIFVYIINKCKESKVYTTIPFLSIRPNIALISNTFRSVFVSVSPSSVMVFDIF